jgi:hypothetical protein
MKETKEYKQGLHDGLGNASLFFDKHLKEEKQKMLRDMLKRVKVTHTPENAHEKFVSGMMIGTVKEYIKQYASLNDIKL